MFQSSGAARCGTCAYTPTRLCIQPSRLLSCPFRLSSTPHPLLAPPGRCSSTSGKRFSCRRVTPLNIKWHREPIVPSRTFATASEPASLSYFLFLHRIRAFFAPVQASSSRNERTRFSSMPPLSPCYLRSSEKTAARVVARRIP